MNQEDYERRLSEVCSFSKPSQDKNGQDKKGRGQGQGRKGRPLGVTNKDYDNESLPIKVQSLKIKPSVCDLCGKICSQGQHYERRLLHRNGFEAWRYNCTVCRLVEDPWTGEMKHSFGTATTAWDKYIKTCKAMHEDLKKLGK